MQMSTAAERSTGHRLGSAVVFAAVAVIGFSLRLWPVVAGGGLLGRGNYDDGVYYAAAAGFAHGLMPYRDFLLLHPPGIVLFLAPFAVAARWLGDPAAFAAARVLFMVIGAVNAVLVALILRRVNLAAALAGGLFYAVYFPAVYAEHTTLLEPLATTCVLGAMSLLTWLRRDGRVAPVMIVAGILLGFSASIKIWGVVPALAVIGWVVVSWGWRRAGWITLGTAAGATAVCLPFFAAAPAQMWRLVVLSQLGRPAATHSWLDRAVTIAGLTPLRGASWWWLAIAGVVLVVCCVAAARSPVGRLSLVVFLPTAAMLFSTPSWFQHYAAAAAGGLALVVGAAAGWFAARMHRPVLTGLFASVIIGALMLGYAPAVEQRPYGGVFPTARLAPAVTSAPGCVTTDDPISLIELDVLRRNLDRGCPLVADLGGDNYAIQVGAAHFRARAKNQAWQRVALDYLRSGDVTIVGIRFRRGFGYSRATAATISSWPVRARAGSVTVREPAGEFAAR